MFYGDQVITATKGWQQGDPLSSFMFALTLLPLMEQIRKEVKDLKVNVWYLDDGHMMGTDLRLICLVTYVLVLHKCFNFLVERIKLLV